MADFVANPEGGVQEAGQENTAPVTAPVEQATPAPAEETKPEETAAPEEKIEESSDEDQIDEDDEKGHDDGSEE